MATRREYLVSLGLAKEGRGRFSQAAKDALAKAENDGMVFDDPAPAAKGPTERKPKEKSESVKSSGVLVMPARRYPEGTRFQGYVDGKKFTVNDRQACACLVSLAYCRCNNPSALVAGGERVPVSPV